MKLTNLAVMGFFILPTSAYGQTVDDRAAELECQLDPAHCASQIAAAQPTIVIPAGEAAESGVNAAPAQTANNEVICTTASTPEPSATTDNLECEIAGICGEEVEVEANRAKTCITGVDSRGPMSDVAMGLGVSTDSASASLTSSAYTAAQKKIDPNRAGRADLHVSFELGSDKLTYESLNEIRSFATAVRNMSARGSNNLYEIEGHTDSAGSRSGFDNRGLSQRRADAVREALEREGIDGARLIANGYAFDRPIGGLHHSDARNRRVEVVVLK